MRNVFCIRLLWSLPAILRRCKERGNWWFMISSFKWKLKLFTQTEQIDFSYDLQHDEFMKKNSQFLIIFGTASKSLQPRFLEIFNIMVLPVVKKSQEIWTTMQHNIQRSLVNQTVGSEFDIHPLFAIMIEELDGCWKEPPLYRHLVGQFHLLRG